MTRHTRNIGKGPACTNPSNLTLITQSGGDNRGYMLDKSLAQCKKVFDRMIVVDSGATDNTREVCLKHGAEVIDFDLSKDHHPEMFAVASASVPMGEWIWYMDSDECPSPMLLCSFKELVARGNAAGLVRYDLPHATHWFDADDKLVGANLTQILQFHPGMWLSTHVAHRPRLLKKNESLTLEYTGSHWSAVNEGQGMFIPLHWNHYKGDKSVCQSSFIHGLAYPEEHNLGPDHVKDYHLIEEWNALKESEGYTMKEIASWSASKEAPSKVVEIISKWKGANSVANEIWMHVFKFGYNGDEPMDTCTCPFCDYSLVDSLLNPS